MPPPLGGIPPRTLEAFNRAIALDSGFAPAYEHTVGLNLRVGRPDLAVIHAARRLELAPTAESSEAIRLAAFMLDPDRAGSAEAARLLDTASIHAIFSAGMEYLGHWPDSGESAIRLFRRLGDGARRPGGTAPWVLDSLMWPQYLARALTFRGKLQEAYETDRLLLRQPEASAWSWFQDPFLELALLGAVPDSAARATFARALDRDAPWSIGSFGFPPRHLRGLPWWLARGDTVSLSRMAERAGQVARRPGPVGETRRAVLVGAVAAAYLALARGDSTSAMRSLAATPDTLCLQGVYDPICADARLTLARLHAARGEHRRAADLLDVLRWQLGGSALVLATLERGRLAERLGEREQAIESYGFVTAAWRRADPVLQPYVTEARRGLERLKAD
jgi:tetratricopeptide (TPR) repeat protein